MKSIKVIYHTQVVGILSISSKTKKVLFQYDENWIKNGFSISPLSLPLNDSIFEVKNDLFDGLFGVFADSLPDAWGQLLFSKYIKENNIQVETILDRLSFIGKNGMGALEYEPYYENKNEYNYDVDLDKIQDDCNLLLDSKNINDLDNLYHLGSSSGGARPKILINYKDKELLIKFSSKYDDKSIANIEFEYMNLAKKCGINIPYIDLIKTEKNHYFCIERFDRNNNNKLHMISVAALLECDFRSPCLDYVDLIKLTKILTKDDNDVYEMYRRMVFNVYFKNLDDHAKNFSFLYDEELKRYKLSPAYDLTPGKTYYNEHTTSVNGKRKDINEKDLLAVAEKSYLNKNICKKIIEDIKNISMAYFSKKDE